jgi:hypothetical protein
VGLCTRVLVCGRRGAAAAAGICEEVRAARGRLTVPSPPTHRAAAGSVGRHNPLPPPPSPTWCTRVATGGGSYSAARTCEQVGVGGSPRQSARAARQHAPPRRPVAQQGAGTHYPPPLPRPFLAPTRPLRCGCGGGAQRSQPRELPERLRKRRQLVALQVPAPRHTSASAPTLGPRATPPKRTTPVRVRTRCRTRDAVLVRGRRGGGRLDPVRPPAPPSPQCCPVELMRRGGHVQPPPRAYLVKMPLKNGPLKN